MKIANVLVSDSWGEVTPDALNKGIGGREGALLYLSREWSKLGHQVTNFVNVEAPRRFLDLQEGGYHEYIPLDGTKAILSYIPHDAVIAWECPSVFNDEEIKNRNGVKICEMQVAHLSDKETRSLEENCDYLAVLSKWHGDLLLNSGTKFPEEKVVVFPNGVNLQRYPLDQITPKFLKRTQKNAKFVYSSSPDRGLWTILKMWPYLREEYPQAELYVCYGAKNWIDHLKWSHGRIGEMALEIEELLNLPGVNNLGKIGQDVLAKLQIEADAWIYPLDSIQSTETGCITAVENGAAGNPIITTDADCMKDEFGKVGHILPLPFDEKEFSEKTIEVLNDYDYLEYLRHEGRKMAESRNWEEIAKKWLTIFNGPN